MSAQAQQKQTAETKPAASGLACFENLKAPEYPQTALRERMDGSVWTWTQVNAQGAVDNIETEVVSAWSRAPELFTAPVEKAIRAAKVKPECAGTKVWVVFRYDLSGSAVAEPEVTSRADGDNILWIESQPVAASGGAGRNG